MRYLLTLALMASTTSAEAITYSGNPQLHIEVADADAFLTEGDVELEKLRIWNCSSGYTDYTVGSIIDPVKGWTSVDLGAGDYCGATLFWDTTMTLEGEDASSNSIIVAYSQATTSITFATEISPVDLTPFVEEVGSLPTKPQLFASMQ